MLLTDLLFRNDLELDVKLLELESAKSGCIERYDYLAVTHHQRLTESLERLQKNRARAQDLKEKTSTVIGHLQDALETEAPVVADLSMVSNSADRVLKQLFNDLRYSTIMKDVDEIRRLIDRIEEIVPTTQSSTTQSSTTQTSSTTAITQSNLMTVSRHRKELEAKMMSQIQCTFMILLQTIVDIPNNCVMAYLQSLEVLSRYTEVGKGCQNLREWLIYAHLQKLTSTDIELRAVVSATYDDVLWWLNDVTQSLLVFQGHAEVLARAEDPADPARLSERLCSDFIAQVLPTVDKVLDLVSRQFSQDFVRYRYAHTFLTIDFAKRSIVDQESELSVLDPKISGFENATSSSGQASAAPGNPASNVSGSNAPTGGSGLAKTSRAGEGAYIFSPLAGSGVPDVNLIQKFTERISCLSHVSWRLYGVDSLLVLIPTFEKLIIGLLAAKNESACRQCRSELATWAKMPAVTRECLLAISSPATSPASRPEQAASSADTSVANEGVNEVGTLPTRAVEGAVVEGIAVEGSPLVEAGACTPGATAVPREAMSALACLRDQLGELQNVVPLAVWLESHLECLNGLGCYLSLVGNAADGLVEMVVEVNFECLRRFLLVFKSEAMTILQNDKTKLPVFSDLAQLISMNLIPISLNAEHLVLRNAVQTNRLLLARRNAILKLVATRVCRIALRENPLIDQESFLYK
ncbi:hypothetical protein GNI_036690 [Gregarina niphandrodes]|uniref:Uncharacterized protein n=1 Tax=Gregarina niphandrodes TaxID=110365 RepID=A0A023BAN4_GRENI|nr:hypothetical protein GNI_036690 [Gregarina niphandrodes]EZG78409.1 hypothetical protein GNI_036690 [Gregarina niphandrodes]|eukprot:XP_011129315.1 hypothetical protein GNI_036690 [Gregarina niphandrodes]